MSGGGRMKPGELSKKVLAWIVVISAPVLFIAVTIFLIQTESNPITFGFAVQVSLIIVGVVVGSIVFLALVLWAFSEVSK